MKKIVILISIIFPTFLVAQYGESIRTGRPGQAIGGFVLGQNVFQIQTGYNFNQVKNESSSRFTTSNTTVFRFGISDRIELSSLVNWQTDRISSDSLLSSRGGISSTQIGGRINFTRNKGWLPTIGLQGRILFKNNRAPYRRESFGSKFVLATGNKINDKVSLVTNWGAVWSGNNQGPNYIYIINFSYSVSDKIGAFAEIYGNLDNVSTNYDAGLSYLVNNDFQLDLSTGVQSNNEISDWFVDFGLSWRFDWR